jgi:hypothetical protein
MRAAGHRLTSFSRVSASQACGSTALSLAVYAARRTMPNGLVFPRILRDRALIGSA